MLVVSLFVVLVLFPHMHLRRRHRENPRPAVETLIEVAGAYLGEDAGESQSLLSFPDGESWSFIRRNQWITAAAWASAEVRARGTIRGRTLLDSFRALVPRLFWPDKPLIAPGRDFAVLLGQAKSSDTATTSTGLGLAATLYWNGGLAMLLAGMFLNGLLFALAWQAFGPFLVSNPFASIASMSLIVAGLRHFESAFSGGITYYAQLFIVSYTLLLLTKRAFCDLEARSVRQSSHEPFGPETRHERAE